MDVYWKAEIYLHHTANNSTRIYIPIYSLSPQSYQSATLRLSKAREVAIDMKLQCVSIREILTCICGCSCVYVSLLSIAYMMQRKLVGDEVGVDTKFHNILLLWLLSYVSSTRKRKEHGLNV